MPVWVKAFLALMVTLLPGGFLVLFAYGAYRVVKLGWTAERRANDGEVHVKDVLSRVHFRDILREAWGSF